MTIDVRKRNEDRRTAVSSNSKYYYELLRVYEFAVVETPRCSRVEINSLRLRRSGLDSQLDIRISQSLETQLFAVVLIPTNRFNDLR